MKKEDLCMLLIVIVLVLLISRKTNVFEGFGAEGIPGSMDEMIDMVSGEPSSPPAPLALHRQHPLNLALPRPRRPRLL